MRELSKSDMPGGLVFTTRTSGVPSVESLGVSERLPSDSTLLELCYDGDVEAWDRLVARYERLIFSVALRNGVDRADAADVTQSTFESLLEALPQIRDERRLASWLMTVARRQAWRVNRRRARESAGTVPEQFLVVDPIPDWERVAVLHDALVRLGGPCAELIAGLYLDPTEPSYAEVASRMGRSIGGIGPMRGRCLEKLRELISEEGR